MKKLFLLLLLTVNCLLPAAFAQSPEKINYQGVARDNSGNVLASDAIGLRITIRSVSGSGTIVYRETHSVTTNAFGLFNIQIGGGTIVSGTLAGIDWAANTYYVETEMDPAGGTSYTSLGAQQLVSVPYSLYAKKAANVSGTTNYIPKFTPNGTTLGNSRIFDTGNYTGIGTAFPVWDLDLHNPTAFQTMFHITNSSTGIMESDGLSLGLSTASGDASLMNGESGKYLSFGTDGTERMRIDPYGNIGIGATSPLWNMQLNSAGSETVLQISAAAITGISDLDGLLLGINSTGGSLINMENSGIYLGNSSTGGINIADDGNIGIGMGIASPVYKLDVAANTVRVGNFINSNTTSDYYGVYAACNNTPFYGIGVNALGGYIGINAEATLTGTGTRYGVYAYAAGGSTNWAIYAAGSAYSTGLWQTSDERFKTDISPLDNAISKINRLEPRSYNFKAKEYAYMGLPEELQYGFMAQDLEKVFPELVRDIDQPIKASAKEEGMIHFKGINYVELIPVMVKGMQEQQQIIEALNDEMEALKREVQTLKK